MGCYFVIVGNEEITELRHPCFLGSTTNKDWKVEEGQMHALKVGDGNGYLILWSDTLWVVILQMGEICYTKINLVVGEMRLKLGEGPSGWLRNVSDRPS